MSISLSFSLALSQTHTERIKRDRSGLREALDAAGYYGDYSVKILHNAYSVYCRDYAGIKAHTRVHTATVRITLKMHVMSLNCTNSSLQNVFP